MVLLGIFAGIALLLAAVGIYGVMAYLVGQGAREIGIRLAMGATPQRILRLILGEGMRLAFLGALLGLAGAYVLTRFMESLLFETAATDVLTLLLTPVLLLGASDRAPGGDSRFEIRDSKVSNHGWKLWLWLAPHSGAIHGALQGRNRYRDRYRCCNRIQKSYPKLDGLMHCVINNCACMP